MNIMQTSSQQVKNSKPSTRQARQVQTWLLWVLTSAISGLITLALAAEVPPFLAGVIPSGDEANETGYSFAWAVILAGFLTGASFGGFQWLILRKRLAGHISGWCWVGVSALAVGVSFTLAWSWGGGVSGSGFAHHGLPHAVDNANIWGGLLIGAMLGIGQWLLLRSKLPGLNRAWGLWVPANLIGFGVGWWVAARLSAPSEDTFGPMNHFWGGAIFGIVFGFVTGVVVAKLATVRRAGGTRQVGN